MHIAVRGTAARHTVSEGFRVERSPSAQFKTRAQAFEALRRRKASVCKEVPGFGDFTVRLRIDCGCVQKSVLFCKGLAYNKCALIITQNQYLCKEEMILYK